MNAPSWVEMQTARDADRLSDALNYSERLTREAEYADQRTREIRHTIAGLGKNITEREVCAIVSSLITAMAFSGWSHTETANIAEQGLLDAVGALENAE